MQIELKKPFEVYYFRYKGFLNALKLMITSLMENTWPTCHVAFLRFCDFWEVRHWSQTVEGLKKEYLFMNSFKIFYFCTYSFMKLILRDDS